MSARQTDTTIARDMPPKGNEPQGRCRRASRCVSSDTGPRFGRASIREASSGSPDSGTSRHFGDGPRPESGSRRVSRTPAVASASAGGASLHLGGDRLVRQATLPRFGARTSQSAAKTCAADWPSGPSVSRRQPRLPKLCARHPSRTIWSTRSTGRTCSAPELGNTDASPEASSSEESKGVALDVPGAQHAPNVRGVLPRACRQRHWEPHRDCDD